MSNKWQVSPDVIHAMTRNKIWATAITSGGITAAVLYWISQLPPAMRETIRIALENYFKAP